MTFDYKNLFKDALKLSNVLRLGVEFIFLFFLLQRQFLHLHILHLHALVRLPFPLLLLRLVLTSTTYYNFLLLPMTVASTTNN